LPILTVTSNNSPYQAATMTGVPMLAADPSSDFLLTTSVETACFVVGFPPEDLAFTIMLTDTARIQEARDIVNGVQTESPSDGYHHQGPRTLQSTLELPPGSSVYRILGACGRDMRCASPVCRRALGGGLWGVSARVCLLPVFFGGYSGSRLF
jgi:hypothetical protein